MEQDIQADPVQSSSVVGKAIVILSTQRISEAAQKRDNEMLNKLPEENARTRLTGSQLDVRTVE
eukprot:15307758-Ditylum_brightwellii.AAC.2